MAQNQLSKGTVRVGGLVVGGKQIGGILTGTVSIDPANLTAGAIGTEAVAISGVTAADIVIFEPPAALEAGIVYRGAVATATGANVLLYNPSAGAVNGSARDWTYKVIKAS